MKILLLCDRMESGGAETHIETLARGLLRNGHTVGLFSYGGRIADRLAREGVLCRTVAPVGRNAFAFLAAKRILAEQIRKNGYEILHAHTRMMALLSNQICRPYMQKSPKLPANAVTAHAFFRSDGVYRLFSRWGEETIAVSEDLRAYLIDRYRLPAERVTVIPNGIDAVRFCPAPIKDEPTENNGESPAEVLFVSRLEPDCSLGAELLCRAAERFLEEPAAILPFHITIAGNGSRFEAIGTLAARVNLRAGREVVRMVRPQGEEDLIVLYRRARLFVGVSRAAMEASFCGCAVLLCGNEGYGGILSPDRLELAAGNFTCRGMPRANENVFAKEVAFWLNHPHLCAANAQKTSAWMRKNFSADQALQATETIYRRLLWRRGKGEYPT